MLVMLPRWDMSKVRPAGAKLKTFGGRASGPEPLDDFVYILPVICLRRLLGVSYPA